QLELIRNKRQLQELNQNLEEKVTQRTLELRQANKQLAQLEKAKSDFLTIISHELRTPLNGIIGITSLLKQSIDDVEQKEYLDYLNNSSERLVRFAETALLITSLQFNNQQVELFDIDIENLFEMVVYELQAALDEKEIKVEIEVGKDARIVKGDSDLLQKSFCILAENAISHLPTGGRIWLSSSLTDGSLSLEVRDDGKGFSDEVLNRLQNFVTQDHITIEHGFGLSLAAVKLIIRAHNGRVILKNDDKGGAVVQLHFNC
ncbi:MAG TPA: HAMP domain-containing sensor histidine kinase, partial [Bacteroidales bacterium]|nr:HAMP domain-containing sensor histidine kinase [Bacteroidales bacterium]